ncbi:MAG: YibE/F family protein [Candidatus Falkowbacteria bacterium]
MKYAITIIILLFLFCPHVSRAQETPEKDEIFQARIIAVIAEEEKTTEDGNKFVQQHLRLTGLEGRYDGKEFEFNGIGDIDVLSKHVFASGDKVTVAASYGEEGEVNFYIVDYVRSDSLWLAAALFLAALLAIGRFKGLRSLIALTVTFLIILKYMIPQILSGTNPLLVTAVGSVLILFSIIYITEGFCSRANISVLSIFLSLILTVVLANIFVGLTKLTGVTGEDVLFLSDIAGTSLNLRGLLLAGIIIGTLGVLDDIVISQVATVEQIAGANRNFTKKELFGKAYDVGTSHIASMTNTLFLAYAGASLPLLVLFVSGASAFTGWTQAINTELIATEIVRTLAGSIGLILAVPISTYAAVLWYGSREQSRS